MERLTKKHYGADDYYMACSENCANDAQMCGGCPWLDKIINRLGEYEDTGLDPDDVTDLMAAHGTAIGQLTWYRGIARLERIREIAQAEKNGRLVVLPCKVGDTVYRVIAKKKYLNNPKNAMYIKEIAIKPENVHKYISEIGKTVFLTREEAEVALEAKKGGDEK